MSGGSYDYLCHKDLPELLNMSSTIQQMADRLAGLGYATDAARETQEFLLNLRQFENRMAVAQHRLGGIWRAVEWWDSGDSGEDDLKQALEKYRTPETKGRKH